MARRVFYSFHYKEDSWRVSQVRNIGALEGNMPASDNDWEQVKKGGDAAIEKWIENQMKNRTCTLVLIGANTAKRKWINYEIIKSWNDEMGVAGIYIHGLKNEKGEKSKKGDNPFDFLTFKNNKLSTKVKCYDPPGTKSEEIYDWIANNIAQIVEEAIKVRNS